MKTLTLLFSVTLLMMSAPAYAGHDGMDMNHDSHAGETVEPNATPAKAVKTGDVHVSVNGLVCDFCARALEKTFGKRAEVKGIDVNLDTKIVTINFNDGQTLDDDTIRQIITDSGYNVEGVHRVE